MLVSDPSDSHVFCSPAAVAAASTGLTADVDRMSPPLGKCL